MQLKSHPDVLQSILDVEAANPNTQNLIRSFRSLVSDIDFQMHKRRAYIDRDHLPRTILQVEEAITFIVKQYGASAPLRLRKHGFDSLVRIDWLVLVSRKPVTRDVGKHFIATTDLADAIRGILRVMLKKELGGFDVGGQSWARWQKFGVEAMRLGAFEDLQDIESSLLYGKNVDGEDGESQEEGKELSEVDDDLEWGIME